MAEVTINIEVTICSELKYISFSLLKLFTELM